MDSYALADARLVAVKALAAAAEHGGEPRITKLAGVDRWEVAAIERHGDGSVTCLASDVIHSDGTSALLTPGTRVRHRRHHELVGVVHAIERKRDGSPSGIPYNVRWDNDGRAADLLGWFYIYATDHGIEAVDV